MMVSATAFRVHPNWLQACLLLCAIVVLPVGLTCAQDYEAVGKRLRAAVEAGELTGKQARMMLGALRKTDGTEKDQLPDGTLEYLMKVKKELGAAVEAGKISKEDAVRRYAGVEKAVKQSRQKMAADRSEQGSKRISREDLQLAGIKIRKAVGEGKISAEEGRAKMRAMRKMMRQQSKDTISEIKRPDWDNIKKRVEGAVERGDMTREEADTKYKEIRKQTGQQLGDSRPDWDNIKKRVEGAVERGDMTREEADAKYKEIRKQMAGRRQP